MASMRDELAHIGPDELRDEYDLAELGPGQRGKYAAAYALGRQESLDVPHNSAGDLWIAIACGAIPLLTGSAIYWAWRFTRWEVWPRLGLLTVLIGTVFFVVGIIHLGRYWSRAHRRDADTNSRRDVRSLFVAALLIANFPIAGFYAISAVEHMSDYFVHVSNVSDQNIDSLTLVGPGIETKVGPIRSGEEKTITIRFTGEGPLHFQAQQGQELLQGELDGYVCGGLGGDTSLRLLPNGRFDVRRKWDTSFLAGD